MTSSARYRQIRLLIRNKKHSEALTEMLMLLRALKKEGISVEKFMERRHELVDLLEDKDIGHKITQLLNAIIFHVRSSTSPEPPPKPKGDSIFSKIFKRWRRKTPSRSEAHDSHIPPLRYEKKSGLETEEEEWEEEASAPIEEWDDTAEESVEEIVEEVEPEPASEPPAPPALPATETPSASASRDSRTEEDIVNISLFAPEHVQKNEKFLLTAFAHLYEQKAEVADMMREADPDASIQGAKTLNMPIKRRSRLEFRLSIENWKIEESAQALIWFGVPASVEFEILVPADFERKQAIGSLIIMGEEGQLGRLRFNLQLVEAAAHDNEDGKFAPTHAKAIKKTFLAYAKENTSALDNYRNQLTAEGVSIIDPYQMPGDDWEIKVSDALLETELFCLFWSKAAEDSEEVAISWQMALGQRLDDNRRLPDMLPILIEEPAPEAPDGLEFLNFTSSELRFKAATDISAIENVEDLKRTAEELLMKGKEEFFDLLYLHFKADSDTQQKVMMLQGRWNSMHRMKRIRRLSESEAKKEENRIIHAGLDLIGLVK
ncbi:MAG: TIR domain-containing protein [Bacteroidia bacterium]|nr:TIR domain-containing protein [Bacteroidia bacterium]